MPRRARWKHLPHARFSEAEKKEILAAFLANGLFPVTYSFLAGKNRFSYFWERSGEAQRAFIGTRTGSAAGSERARELFSADGILDGDVFYFACLGEKEKLLPVCEALRARYRCFFAPDIYLKAQWLEIVKKDSKRGWARKSSSSSAMRRTTFPSSKLPTRAMPFPTPCLP